MKKFIFPFAFIFFFKTSFGQTVWNGEKVTFSKEAFSDWTLAENQDRITDEVWLTRADVSSLFNIKEESAYELFVSPSGTQWAFGTTNGMDTLQFDSFQAIVEASGNGPQSLIGKNLVLLLTENNIYLDISFLSWGGGNSGASFSYERSTSGIVAVQQAEDEQPSLFCFPNPMTDILAFNQAVYGQVSVFDCMGKLETRLQATGQKSIDLGFLQDGVYFLQITGDGNKPCIIKFIKH